MGLCFCMGGAAAWETRGFGSVAPGTYGRTRADPFFSLRRHTTAARAADTATRRVVGGGGPAAGDSGRMRRESARTNQSFSRAGCECARTKGTMARKIT